MKNKLIAIALTTLTLTASIVPTVAKLQPVTAQTTNTAQWQLFSPKGQRFSILMPLGKIEEKVEKNGKEYTISTDNELFNIGVGEYQQENIGNESEMLENLAAKTKYPDGYRLISRRRFGLNGHQGIELNYSSESFPQKITARALIAEGKYYFWMAVSDSPERANIFLSSFRLR
jgi:hypothetical protein